MGTDRNSSAIRRRPAAGAAPFAADDTRTGTDPGAAAIAAAPALAAPAVQTTVIRRFRRGRWTLTTLAV